MAKQSNELTSTPAPAVSGGAGLVVLRDFVNAAANTTHQKGEPCPDAEPAVVAKWKRLSYVGVKPAEKPAEAATN